MKSLLVLRARARTKATPLGVLALALLAGLAGCERTKAGDSASTGALTPEREVRDLVTALTPPAATALPVEKSEFYLNRKRMLERLRGASRAHGEAALALLREERPTLPEVRSGLLDVAAHTAPEATVEILVNLTTVFGDDLYVRKNAAVLLGECMPLRAIEVLEPILRERADDRTYPPEDALLDAWLAANEKLELDPVPLLVLVATDLKRSMDVRHRATKALARYPSDMGRQALENVLVESSGNGYIRRLALQALRESLPQEAFCELARRTQERESDPEFVLFIQDHLDSRCR
jgi:hypothetical protein